MSDVIGRDATEDGATTRIYVWYPDGSYDWRADPLITDYLQEMRGPNNEYELTDARYYHNPKPTGEVRVIARLVLTEPMP